MLKFDRGKVTQYAFVSKIWCELTLTLKEPSLILQSARAADCRWRKYLVNFRQFNPNKIFRTQLNSLNKALKRVLSEKFLAYPIIKH